MMKSTFFNGPSQVIIAVLLASCQTDQEAVEPIQNSNPYQDVDPNLVPYFIQFEEEGQLRGYDIDLTAFGITGVIQEIEAENVAGQCSYSFHDPRRVTIDDQFWTAASDSYREFIVFHELGHCYLGRGHLEDSYPNGRCVSIMRSGLGDCWDYYYSRTRQDYVDELFETEIVP